MSYCRFSSDNWKSDVYVYEGSNGFNIHVAGMRYTTEIPKVLPYSEVSHDEWFASYQKQMEVIQKAESKKIGGIYDGEAFVFDDAQSTIDKLQDIKEHGYNVPQFAIDSLQEEISDA